MILRSLLLASILFGAVAHAQTAPPAADQSAASPQEIDVDALARAKDVNANAAAAKSEPAATAESPVAQEPAAAAGVSADAPALTPPAIDPQKKRQASGCEARSNALLDAAQKGDFATATKDFDAKMRGGLPPAKFKDTWASMAQFGALKARGQPHPGEGEGYFVVMTPLIFDKANLVAQVACGSDGLIAGFYVKPLSAAQ
ncbi:MAG: DUF3887 domain-containing protein [Dokdonella sp.]